MYVERAFALTPAASIRLANVCRLMQRYRPELAFRHPVTERERSALATKGLAAFGPNVRPSAAR
jgi:hypothetical protein